MGKSKIWTLVGIGTLILATASVYWFYFSKPVPFPANNQLIGKINDIYPDAKARMIKDTIYMDERHMLVPFISKYEDYGLSYWVWKNHSWSIASVDTKGEPEIWEINKKDPSSFRFVWNIDPKDQQSYLKFYFLRDRNFVVANGQQTYYPRIQMEKKVSLSGQTYGSLKLPKDWVHVMNPLRKIESEKKTGMFLFNDSNNDQYFGWNSYNLQGKVMLPQGSVNGSGYSSGDETISYLRFMDGHDLE